MFDTFRGSCHYRGHSILQEVNPVNPQKREKNHGKTLTTLLENPDIS